MRNPGKVQPVQALTYEFKGTMTQSLFLTGAPEIGLEANPDLYTGRFSFDSSSFTGVGLEIFGLESGLTVFLYDDPRVNETVDPGPDSPQVRFQDGELLGLYWNAIYHPFTTVPEQGYPGDFVHITGSTFTDGFDPTFYTEEDEPRSPVLGFGTVEYTHVNEPRTIIPLAAMSLFALSSLRKKTFNLTKVR